MSSNLPPGVTDSMIPGNRPEDVAWESFHELIDGDCERQDLTPKQALEIWMLGMYCLNTIKNL